MNIYNPLNLLIALVVGGLLLSSCDAEKQEQKALFDEVMKVHDEVMPDMGKLMGLSKQLKGKAITLSLDSTNTVSQEQAKVYAGLAIDLEVANEQMMSWMRNFELVEETTPHEEAMIYLNEKLVSVQKVRDAMNLASSKAEAALKEN